MAKSTYCEKARQEASSSDPTFVPIITSLKRRIQSDDMRAIINRRAELLRLFNGLEPGKARTLLAILKNRQHPIGRLFKCQLATAFRGELLRILESKPKKKRGPSPHDFSNDRKTDDKGTDNTGVDFSDFDFSGFSGNVSGIPGGRTNLGEGGLKGQVPESFVLVDPPPDESGEGPINKIINRAKQIVNYMLATDPGNGLLDTFKDLLNRIDSSSILISSYLQGSTLLIIGGTLYVGLKGRILGEAKEILINRAARSIRDRFAGSRIIYRLEVEIDKLERAMNQLTTLTIDVERGLAVARSVPGYSPVTTYRSPIIQGPGERLRSRQQRPDDIDQEEPEERMEILYHGTTRRRAEKIEEEVRFAQRKTWFALGRSNRDLAYIFANRAISKYPREGGPRVLVIQIPERTIKRLRALGLFFSDSFGSEDRPELRNRTQWVLEPGGIEEFNNAIEDVWFDN